ncbi:hypothetical protein MKK63_25980 [Methylobacterium sp. J-088]|uniref:hypothetical protein n=1 Tax=unclassified Methylobacterium TaxID=2615210 RepID=UPI001FBB210E|nr:MULTISPECIES: hypothetical protein [unclassified Methylobacterium]MCJ2066124.1 hypothetical protein [Methylobacterium sp. J-088]
MRDRLGASDDAKGLPEDTWFGRVVSRLDRALTSVPRSHKRPNVEACRMAPLQALDIANRTPLVADDDGPGARAVMAWIERAGARSSQRHLSARGERGKTLFKPQSECAAEIRTTPASQESGLILLRGAVMKSIGIYKQQCVIIGCLKEFLAHCFLRILCSVIILINATLSILIFS